MGTPSNLAKAHCAPLRFHTIGIQERCREAPLQTVAFMMSGSHSAQALKGADIDCRGVSKAMKEA